MERKTLLIVGGGISGVSAAHAARSEYPGADIHLLSAESGPLYNKIALNSYVTGEKRKDHLGFYPLGDLQSKNINVHRNVQISTVDRENRIVRTADGADYRFDSLILATGARSVGLDIPHPSNGPIHPLWTLEDAERIRGSLETSGRILILGNGVLGVEMALALRESGRQVILAGRRPEALPRLLDGNAAELYSRSLENAGVEFRLPSRLLRIDSQEEQTGSALRAVFADGTSEDCDLILVMTGAEPNDELARSAGLICRRGIEVNEYMETSHPGILACGNCTIPTEESGLLWNPAIIQGECAGRNAFGRRIRRRDGNMTIHLKTPRVPAFICGPRFTDSLPDGYRRISDTRDGGHRTLILDSDRHIISATFVLNVSGTWEVEQARAQAACPPAGSGCGPGDRRNHHLAEDTAAQRVFTRTDLGLPHVRLYL